MRIVKQYLLSHTALASAISLSPLFALATMAGTTLGSSPALSAACAVSTNGTVTVNNSNNNAGCSISAVAPIIGNNSAGAYGFRIYSQGLTRILTVDSDLTTTVKGGVGITVFGTNKDFPSILDASGRTINLTIDTTDLNANNPLGDFIAKSGVGVTHASTVKIGTLNLTMHNLPAGLFEHYGVVAGSSVNAAEPATYNGLYSIAEFDNLNISMSTVNNPFPSYPFLVGIRAIQGAGGNSGNGASGRVDVKENLVINLAAQNNDAVGIYVSGGDSQVNLNNSTISVTSESARAHAILLGKQRAIGTGSGKLTSTGNMVLDTTQAANTSTIAVIWQGALLDANEDTSSTTIKSANTAISISGNKDSTGPAKTITSFNNLVATTTSATASLINVAANQSEYELNIRGANSDLTASAGGYLINVAGGSTTASLANVNFSQGVMRGLTNKTTDSTLNLNLDNQARWILQENNSYNYYEGDDNGNGGQYSTGKGSSTFTKLELKNGAELVAFGDSSGNAKFTLKGNIISDGGIINLSGGTAGDMLTLKGSYTGTNNALLVLDSFLGASGSVSDRLVNDGITIDGVTQVRIRNTDITNQGAATEPGHGIKIVRSINGGQTTDDSFVLDNTASNTYEFNGSTAVGAGAYAYRLHKGANPNATTTVDEYGETDLEHDWYLRSQLRETEPEYNISVPLYEAYPSVLLGLNGLPTLQQRVGNRFWAGQGNRVIAQGADAIVPYAPAEEAGNAIEGTGIWGRIEGAHNRMQPKSSTSGTDYKQDYVKFQAGVDAVLSENENGKLIGGLFGQYVHGKARTSSFYGQGDITTNGYGGGATLSWYGDNGFYIDAQGHATWYRSDLDADLAAARLANNNHGFGYAVSLESGKRFAIDPAWSVTPQAQLSYSHVKFNDFNDVIYNADVSIVRGASLEGRFGMTLDYENSWQNSQGYLNRSHVYGVANLYYEFLDGTKVDVTGVSFSRQNERLWGGLGIGGSYNWDNDKYSIYGEGLVNTSLAHFGDSYSVKGQLGFRIKW